ncbi:MAG: hypothetical protein HC771_24355 [Synechococcales cyanobacterium CRU_2_2]|nr:hypothetical protein [Synechococcales cyanobacterium CRU_2_2]
MGRSKVAPAPGEVVCWGDRLRIASTLHRPSHRIQAKAGLLEHLAPGGLGLRRVSKEG